MERLQIAREKYSADNIEYLEGRGENIPGSDYDIIFSNYVLHWIVQKEQMFSQVYNSLKAGGKFGFVACCRSIMDEVCAAGMVSAEFEASTRKVETPVLLSEYKQMARQVGFEIVHEREDNKVWEFEDIPKYIEFLQLHTHGKFDHTHFHVDAMEKHYCDKKISFGIPYCTVVCRSLRSH